MIEEVTFVMGQELCMVWTEMEQEVRERFICSKIALGHKVFEKEVSINENLR